MEINLNSTQPVIIQLKKIYSWKATYHKYPFYLAGADPDKFYSYNEVFTEIFKVGSPPTKKGKGQHGWVRAVFGLDIDPINQEIVVNGIGLIEKVSDDCYRLSDAAIELSHSYALDPTGSSWRIKFAEVIARSDIRTRVILYYMGILGYGLSFSENTLSSGFMKSMHNAQLVSISEKVNLLSKIPDEERNEESRVFFFNHLLDRYRFEILGPFIRKQIELAGIDFSGGLIFQGAKIIHGRGYRENPEPSTNELGSYLSQSLSLFSDLGILVFDSSRDSWIVNFARARELFTDGTVQDLFADRREELFEDLLRQTNKRLADEDGYVNIRSLRQSICDHLGISPGESTSYFNRQVARLISEGRIAIGKKMGWRGNAADALFGERSMEYVEFLF